jgi:hypothetical protein
MQAYNELVQNLDSSGARYSQDLSEVDLSDLDNLKVRTNDPAGDVLIELGSSDYLKRYQTYVSHVQQWRQQFQKLESVNLRYDNQVIVNPEMQAGSRQTALAASAAKAAVAAGVRPAALTTRLTPRVTPAHIVPTSALPHDRTVPKPAFELTERKLDPKSAAAKKPAPKARVNKAKAGHGSGAKKVVTKTSASVAKAAPRPGSTHPAVATTSASTQKRQSAKPALSAPSGAAHATIPKPSAAILKPAAGTSSNSASAN